MNVRAAWSPLFAVLLAAVLSAGRASAQSACQNAGSMLQAAAFHPSPLALGCAGAPNWPMWEQYVPAHRTPAPHVGYRQGRAETVPVIVVQYRCTGLLLQPVVVSNHVVMGYVIDMPEVACGG